MAPYYIRRSLKGAQVANALSFNLMARLNVDIILAIVAPLSVSLCSVTNGKFLLMTPL